MELGKFRVPRGFLQAGNLFAGFVSAWKPGIDFWMAMVVRMMVTWENHRTTYAGCVRTPAHWE